MLGGTDAGGKDDDEDEDEDAGVCCASDCVADTEVVCEDDDAGVYAAVCEDVGGFCGMCGCMSRFGIRCGCSGVCVVGILVSSSE